MNFMLSKSKKGEGMSIGMTLGITAILLLLVFFAVNGFQTKHLGTNGTLQTTSNYIFDSFKSSECDYNKMMLKLSSSAADPIKTCQISSLVSSGGVDVTEGLVSLSVWDSVEQLPSKCDENNEICKLRTCLMTGLGHTNTDTLKYYVLSPRPSFGTSVFVSDMSTTYDWFDKEYDYVCKN